MSTPRNKQVAIYIPGAAKPVYTSPALTTEEAERLAESKRAEVKNRGWTHSVRIEEVK